MFGDSVPDTHHISRYVPKKFLDGSRVTGAAFELRRESDKRLAESYLSVNWLELLAVGNRDKEIAEIRRVMARKLTIHKRDKLAVGQVGLMRDNVFNRKC